LIFRVFTVGAFVPATPPLEDEAPRPAATNAAATAIPPIRNQDPRVATAVTLDKEEQVRRIVLLGFVLFAATVAVAAASTGGLPNIGTPSMKTQPVYTGYYDHHIDTYLITDVSSKSQAKAMHSN
jgi:hypothetical protein